MSDLIKKKFKIGFYFETEVEVLAEEGDHERIIENGCDATLDFHAGDVSNEPDEEGLTNWDAPYHNEFKVVRAEDVIEVMVMGAIILIKMKRDEKYVPESYHQQISNELQEDTLEGELLNYDDDVAGSWEIKYKE